MVLRLEIVKTYKMKRVRGKVLTGVELVGAGAALTGGAILLEEAAKPKLPQGHDNVYAMDSGPSLFLLTGFLFLTCFVSVFVLFVNPMKHLQM